MTQIASTLDLKDYTLRSGGAAGADSAFEDGTRYKIPEVYLPWPNFRGKKSFFQPPKPATFEIAKKYHPAWHKLTEAGKKFMARNVHQILGWDLNDPSDFVVCWTADGKASGGTGQALRIAAACKIPIYNLYNEDDISRLVAERLNK
jgi:hypothetical protein